MLTFIGEKSMLQVVLSTCGNNQFIKVAIKKILNNAQTPLGKK